MFHVKQFGAGMFMPVGVIPIEIILAVIASPADNQEHTDGTKSTAATAAPYVDSASASHLSHFLAVFDFVGAPLAGVQPCFPSGSYDSNRMFHVKQWELLTAK
jgi:hypothetical protein